MKCDKIEQLLPFLHDGSLDRSVAREVERHLERCPECAGAYAELSAVVNMSRNVLRARPVSVGPGFVGEVRERIRKRAHARSLYRWAIPVAAAMFLAVSVGTYSLFMEGSVQTAGVRTHTVLTAPQPSLPEQTVTIDENTLINAMYHYADVTLDDFMSRMDENELTAVMNTDKR